MAFRKKFQYILELEPDLLLIQECENEEKLKGALDNVGYNQFLWFGKNVNKGLAAISFNTTKIEIMEDFNHEFEFIVPVHMKIDDRRINLFHIWTMPHQTDRSKNYVGQIWGAINYYSDYLKEDSLLIGDFNSNAIWDKKYRVGNHSAVVEFLNQNEIHSIYHRNFNINHGDEKDPTLFLLKNKQKPYHMDYCFASASLLSAKTSFEVGEFDDWIKLSDHMPIVIDGLL